MGILEEADLAGGKVRFLLEIAHRKWKCICPVGNLFALGDRFSAQLMLPSSEKALNKRISCEFGIGRGLAITQSHQDIVRDQEGVSA